MVLRRSKDVFAKSTQCRCFCNNRCLNYIQGIKQLEYKNHHSFKNTNNLNIRNNGVNNFENAAKQYIATYNIGTPFSNKFEHYKNNFSSNNFGNSNDDNNNGEVKEENHQKINEQEENINMSKNNICTEKANESNNIDNDDNQGLQNSNQINNELFNDKDYSNNVNNINNENNSECINDKDTDYTDNAANAHSENVMENDEDIPNIFDVDENLTEEEKKEKLKLIKLITEKLAGPLKTNNENNLKTDENSKNDDDFIFADNRPIAIEVDGPSHFYANSNRYTTYTKLKHRILTKLGTKT